MEFDMAFNNWEVEEVNNLIATINNQKLEFKREDATQWKKDKQQQFTDKSCYEEIEAKGDKGIGKPVGEDYGTRELCYKKKKKL